MLKKIIVCVIFSTLVISCVNISPVISSDKDDSSLYPNKFGLSEPAKDRAFLGAAQEFGSGNIQYFHTLTGKKVKPCGPLNITSEHYPDHRKGHYNNDETSGCKVTIGNPSENLSTALKLSEKPLPGTIIKDGVENPAEFRTVVFTKYKSSCGFFSTTGGDQVEIEVDCDAFCKLFSELC